MRRAGKFAILGATDKGWAVVPQGSIPEWLKADEAMDLMTSGEILERDGQFFRAVKLEDSPLILPSIRV